MQTPNPEPTTPINPAPKPGRRFGAIAVAGVMAGLIAAAIGGVAAAQTSTTVLNQVERPDVQMVAQTKTIALQEELPEGAVVIDVTPEDEAVWDRFDQCLVDAGLDLEVLDAVEESEMAEFTEVEAAAAEAAFESCEPILDELSEGFEAFADGDFDSMDIDGMELSPEDEALFDQFDQCLADTGIEVFSMVVEPGLEEGDLDEIDLDELDNTELDLDDAEVFEDEYDEATEAELEAAFESCEPILDGLSDDAWFVIDGDEHCDEDDDEG